MGIDARMYVTTTEELSDEEINRLAYRIGDAIGHEHFHRTRPEDLDDSKPWRQHVQHHLHRISVYQQDGPDVHPADGETMLELSLWGRYWGPGYERGDFPKILATVLWLKYNLPNGRVFYGGDSSGVCAEEMTDEKITEFIMHFAQYGREPYVRGMDRFKQERGEEIPEQPVCTLCQVPMSQFAFSQDPAHHQWWCPGCGWKVKRDGEGNVVEVPKEDQRW